MVSSHFVPWYNRPAREFPAKRWLRQRYGFTVSPQVFARPVSRPAGWFTSPPRDFPAMLWWKRQRLLRLGLEQSGPESISWPQHHLIITRRV